MMLEKIADYFERYIEVLRAVEVTDHKQVEMGLYQGIAQSIALLRQHCDCGNKIAFIGNGGSAAIASHFAADFWHAGGMRSICFNEAAQLTCLGNDHGYEEVFSRPIQMFMDSGDVLIAISSSGNSENILRAVDEATSRQCPVISFSGFETDNLVRKMGEINFYVPIPHYGYVESIHKALIHSILDIGGGRATPE